MSHLDEGAIYERVVGDSEIVVYPMIFTTRVCIGDVGDYGYRRAWCYPSRARAVEAAKAWDGQGDPPDGWIKEVGTERRRVDGTAATEYDAVLHPMGPP